MPDDITRQQLELDVQNFLNGLRQAQEGLNQFANTTRTQTDKMTQAFDPLQGILGKLREQFSALLGPLTAIASVKGFVNLMQSASDAAQEMEHFRMQSGLTVTEIQTLEVGLNRVGLGQGDLIMMMRTLNRQIVEARDRSSEAADRFNKLGVSQEMLKRANLFEIMKQIADGIRNYANETERGVVMTEMMSRAGYKIIPLLQGGSKSFEEWAEASKKMGGATEAQIEQLSQLNDELNDLNLNIKRMKDEAAAGTAATFSGIVEVFKQWLQTIWALTKEGGLTALNAALGILGLVLASVRALVKDVADGLYALGGIVVEGLLKRDMEAVKRYWEGFKADIAQTSQEYQAALSKLAVPGFEQPSPLHGPPAPPAEAGKARASDLADERRASSERTKVLEAEWKKKQEIEGYSARAREAFMRLQDAIRKDEISKSTKTADDLKRIQLDYDLAVIKYDKDRNAEQLKNLIAGGTAITKERQEQFQRQLDMVAAHAQQAEDIAKTYEMDPIKILETTMTRINTIELKKTYAARDNEQERTTIHNDAEKERDAARIKYEQDESERRDKLAADDWERQKRETELLNRTLQEQAEREYQAAVESQATFEVREAAFLKMTRAQMRYAYDQAQDGAAKDKAERDMATARYKFYHDHDIEMADRRIKLAQEELQRRRERGGESPLSIMGAELEVLRAQGAKEVLIATDKAQKLKDVQSKFAQDSLLLESKMQMDAVKKEQENRDANLQANREADAAMLRQQREAAQARYELALLQEPSNREKLDALLLAIDRAMYAEALHEANKNAQAIETADMRFTARRLQRKRDQAQQELDEQVRAYQKNLEATRRIETIQARADLDLATQAVAEGQQRFANLAERTRLEIERLEAERKYRLSRTLMGEEGEEERRAINMEIDREVYRQRQLAQQDFIGGLKRGWYQYMTDLESTFNWAVDFARLTAENMTQAFSTFFFDAMSGKITDFKELMSNMKDFMLKIIADLMARLLTLWLMQKLTGMMGMDQFGINWETTPINPMEWKREGGWAGIPRYQFGGPTFLDADRYPAVLRRGEFVLNPKGVDTLSRINQGDLGALGGSGIKNVNVNVVNSGRTDRPQVMVREQMESLVLDIIFKNAQQNGQARNFAWGGGR